MKHLIKNVKKGIVMVTLLVTVIGFASTIDNHVSTDIKATVFTLENVKKGNLLTIKGQSGITLYKELIEKNGNYKKGFDLTALPDGDYIFELEKDVEIKTVPFTVRTNTVIFDKNKETTVFKPVTRIKDSILYLTKLSLDREPLEVKVYFEAGGYHLIHSEKIEETTSIERAYKLSNKGSYKIVCLTEGRQFTTFINN
ncbi:hypothetical protein [Aestuariivivens insulae]|uniref:hypothetical protein n=1 Tax=Aestuariivivens insulae TaxID=1621988 RepID=UPI001F59632B|nr:hypothetical protein [Aestuariivivens insulae]